MFEIRQCTHSACRLRIPVNLMVHRGAYCPRCGAQMQRVGVPFQTSQVRINWRPKRKMRILLDNIRSAYNTGAVLRTADGVGAEHIYLCGITPNPGDHPAIHKTALGAELVLPWSAHPDACALVKEVWGQGFKLVALETTSRSVPVFEVDSSSIGADPVLLVVGNEQSGVDPGLLELCDLVLALPMGGSKGSLNAAVAFGVAAYWLAFI